MSLGQFFETPDIKIVWEQQNENAGVQGDRAVQKEQAWVLWELRWWGGGGAPMYGPGKNADWGCRETSVTGPPRASWGYRHLNLPKAQDILQDLGAGEQMGSTPILAPPFRGPRGNVGGRGLKTAFSQILAMILSSLLAPHKLLHTHHTSRHPGGYGPSVLVIQYGKPSQTTRKTRCVCLHSTSIFSGNTRKCHQDGLAPAGLLS